jgi:saccharopine dehydrogenase-like NADP-dependent oxidoreductase
VNRKFGGVTAHNGILVAGGYGVVGQRIAADLAPDYDVIVGGRRLAQANATAAAIGHGVRGCEINVNNDDSIASALDGIAVIVSCIDQPGRGLLHAAIDRGLAYTDITPHLVELGRGSAYQAICTAAEASGARVVLGTGIVPGISNVIVRSLADSLGGAEVIETSLLLTASDTSGPASLDYFAKELTMPFEVRVDGRDRPARSFSEPREIEYPSPFGWRRSYLFPFSDQVLYPITMGAHTVVTRLAIEPRSMSRLLAAVVRLGAAGLMEQERVRHAITQRRGHNRSSNEAQFALRVDVTHNGRSAHATLLGPAQADAAAAGTSGTVRSLIRGEVSKPGVWMPDQVISPSAFFAHLAKHGLSVNLPKQ